MTSCPIPAPLYVFVPTLHPYPGEGRSWTVAILRPGCVKYEGTSLQFKSYEDALENAQASNAAVGWPSKEAAFHAAQNWAPTRK